MTGIMSNFRDFIDKTLHSYFNIMGEATYMIALPSRKQFGFGFFISGKMLIHFLQDTDSTEDLASLWSKKSFPIAVTYFLLKIWQCNRKM